MRLRIPPGRAGRLWLRERLAAARKAADLMDHKRRELDGELSRMRTICAERERAWRAAMQNATSWMRRVDATGAARSVRLGTALLTEEATIELTWRQVMGVRYAAEYELRLPTEPPISSLNGGAALDPALTAFRHATDAAMAHAIARTALARIESDLERTKRRLRALELRAIPTHEEALRALELSLDEKSREEAVAARWAAEGTWGLEGEVAK
jgi:V/A-type H+-transporting ATPase subunit D